MNDTPEPQWSYLPNSPLQFFGLEVGYDAEQLKRAYGMLVRRFKPDKFPEEFKKIRGAYEQLDRNFRYGQSQADHTLTLPTEPQQTSTRNHSQESEEPPVTTKEFVLQQLEHRNPDQVFHSIASKSAKSPFDFYALAVLSDVVGDNTKSFANWLAEGLIRYPRDAGLACLLLEYAKSNQISHTELSDLLFQMAQSTPREAYFFITEPFWHRLLKVGDWDSFVTTLRKCEQRVDTQHLYSKTAFYVGLLRNAMWKAPIEWLQETCRWLEQDSGGLHGAIDMEYEVYSSLLTMRRFEEDIARKGRFGSLIIQTAKCYCEEDEAISFIPMLECQTEIANHPRDFFEEFPFELTGSPQVFQGWFWISSSLLSQFDGDAVRGRITSIEETVYHSMKEIDAIFPKRYDYWLTACKIGCRMTFVLCSIIALVFLTACTSMACFAILGVNSNWAIGIIFAMIAFYVSAVVWIYKRWFLKFLKKLEEPFFERYVVPHYKLVWRLAIARIFAANHYSFNNVFAVVQGLLQHRRNLFSYSSWLPSLLPHDVGLLVYSLAVRFRR